MDGPVASMAETWFDEIDLDPGATWRRMGTRRLGPRPWLVADDRRAVELANKAELSSERHGEVFAIESGVEAAASVAGRETLDLVDAARRDLGIDDLGIDDRPTVGPAGGHHLHPLDRAGRSVQEDLCLVRPVEGPDGDGPVWVLAGASVCFPSRWRLADKLGRSIVAVHGPVDGYAEELASRVDRLFTTLSDRIVIRRNWFIHPDPRLFQPDRPPGGDPIVAADACLDGLWLRSERQTIRRLATSGWILFTIRTQQDRLRSFVSSPDRATALARYLRDAPAQQLTHRGLAPAQVEQLASAVDGVAGP